MDNKSDDSQQGNLREPAGGPLHAGTSVVPRVAAPSAPVHNTLARLVDTGLASPDAGAVDLGAALQLVAADRRFHWFGLPRRAVEQQAAFAGRVAAHGGEASGAHVPFRKDISHRTVYLSLASFLRRKLEAD